MKKSRSNAESVIGTDDLRETLAAQIAKTSPAKTKAKAKAKALVVELSLPERPRWAESFELIALDAAVAEADEIALPQAHREFFKSRSPGIDFGGFTNVTGVFS